MKASISIQATDFGYDNKGKANAARAVALFKQTDWSDYTLVDWSDPKGRIGDACQPGFEIIFSNNDGYFVRLTIGPEDSSYRSFSLRDEEVFDETLAKYVSDAPTPLRQRRGMSLESAITEIESFYTYLPTRAICLVYRPYGAVYPVTYRDSHKSMAAMTFFTLLALLGLVAMFLYLVINYEFLRPDWFVAFLDMVSTP